MTTTRIAVLTAACLTAAFLSPARAELKVHIIDVGQAASALVELDHAAILIDAGGEETGDDRDARSIRDALNAFFARRTDLHNTLEVVIVSHPHIDHTRNLMVVMQGFTVRELVDDGDKNASASGMTELQAARAFAKTHHIPNIAVKDSGIPAGGKTLALTPGAIGAAQITLLSGFRKCANPNNDSITLLIKDGNASVLFGGDAENEDKSGPCQLEPQLQHLFKRFGQTSLLEAKLYHATHHGSANGVLDSVMQKVHPVASVISAGRLAPQNRTPGDFHAFQFGHPRKQAIDSLTSATTGSRSAAQISFMTEAGSINPGATPTTAEMRKAVYCTCWDGNIDITFAANGDPIVEPLGAAHTSGGTPSPESQPPLAHPACNLIPADIFTPTIKPPDSIKQKPADYFMLSLSWSPEFCTTSVVSNK